jgi:hypothetical protein
MIISSRQLKCYAMIMLWAGAIWNTVRNQSSYNTLAFKPNQLRSKIKVATLNAQLQGEPGDWNRTINNL